MSNGLNLLHPRKDVAEMVMVFCVSLIVPEDLMFEIKSGEHVYQKSSLFVSPLSFLRVSWKNRVSMSWCNCSKMSEVLAGAHTYIYINMMLWKETCKHLIVDDRGRNLACTSLPLPRPPLPPPPLPPPHTHTAQVGGYHTLGWLGTL